MRLGGVVIGRKEDKSRSSGTWERQVNSRHPTTEPHQLQVLNFLMLNIISSN